MAKMALLQEYVMDLVCGNKGGFEDDFNRELYRCHKIPGGFLQNSLAPDFYCTM